MIFLLRAQIEELQKAFHKNEKTFADSLKNLQALLKTHERRLSSLKQRQSTNFEHVFSPILNHLGNAFRNSKFNLQDCVNAIDKLLDHYNNALENVCAAAAAKTTTTPEESVEKKNAFVNAVTENHDKGVQIEYDLSFAFEEESSSKFSVENTRTDEKSEVNDVLTFAGTAAAAPVCWKVES